MTAKSLRIVGGIAVRQVLAVLSAFFEILMTWRENARQRRDLLALSDDMLKDIGVSRAEANHEGSKPFWRN
ncbi:DUF1127 domain-containing protein [Skermanella mucosa]|uniref:DUF1127 domain-containing protein n=1 Tax=Skermanella mucosa TaxID=1789672 RepID=UPI00192B34F4|nr:DUF1127 domain-containing protein [Skermanella mucosa]UEM23203.1 DUF1127 domain-containing protein [Skermanella mucosa]